MQFARLLNERFLDEVIKRSTGHSLEVLNDASNVSNDLVIVLNEFFMLIKMYNRIFIIEKFIEHIICPNFIKLTIFSDIKSRLTFV